MHYAVYNNYRGCARYVDYEQGGVGDSYCVYTYDYGVSRRVTRGAFVFGTHGTVQAEKESNFSFAGGYGCRDRRIRWDICVRKRKRV